MSTEIRCYEEYIYVTVDLVGSTTFSHALDLDKLNGFIDALVAWVCERFRNQGLTGECPVASRKTEVMERKQYSAEVTFKPQLKRDATCSDYGGQPSAGLNRISSGERSNPSGRHFAF